MIELLSAADKKKLEELLLVEQDGEWGPIDDGMFCSAKGKVSITKITGAKLKPSGYVWSFLKKEEPKARYKKPDED